MNSISRRAASRRGGRRLAEVGPQQAPPAALVELVVDREVGEVEVAVAHARVLPVDDPTRSPSRMKFAASRSLWHGTGSCSGPLSARLDLIRARRERLVVGGGDARRRARARSPRSPRRSGTSRSSGERGAASCIARSAPATSARARPRAAPRRSSRAVDELGDDAPAGRRASPRPAARSRPRRPPGWRRAPRSRSMPSSFVSLPGHPDHVVAAAEADPVVAVGDPAVERLRVAAPARPSRAPVAGRSVADRLGPLTASGSRFRLASSIGRLGTPFIA